MAHAINPARAGIVGFGSNSKNNADDKCYPGMMRSHLKKGKDSHTNQPATGIKIERPQRGGASNGCCSLFFFASLLPLLLRHFYYARAIATDPLCCRAGFFDPRIEPSAGIDGIGALTGLASAGSTHPSDSYIVLSIWVVENWLRP